MWSLRIYVRTATLHAGHRMLQLIKLTVTVVHCSNVEKEPLKLLRAFWFFLTRRAELGSETDVRCHPPETETSCYVWRPSRDRDDVVETETTTPSAIHRQIFQCEAVYLQRVLSNMQRGVCCSCNVRSDVQRSLEMRKTRGCCTLTSALQSR